MNLSPKTGKNGWGELRVDWIFAGALIYVVLGQIVRFIPNPIVPDAILALNMTVPVIAGFLGGPSTGMWVGLVGTIFNFAVKIPFEGLDYFELAAVIPHGLMGTAAGWVGKQQSRIGTAATLLVGHAANIMIFLVAGLFSASLVFTAGFWTGLMAEAVIGLILVMVGIWGIERFRGRRLYTSTRWLRGKELFLYIGIVLLPTVLLALGYFAGATEASYLFILPVILSGVLLGELEAWLTALFLSVPPGLVILAIGTAEAKSEVSLILALNLVALSIGELVGNLKKERYLARERAQELERACAVLNESDRLKANLIQNVSHELRTPLAIILGYAELLEGEEFGALEPDQKNAARIVSSYGRQLAYLVEQTTTLYQVQVGEFDRESFLLDLVVQKALQRVERWRYGSNHSIRLSIEETGVWIEGDSAHLERAMESLLQNATKFSPRGGEIKIRLWVGDDRAFVTVADQGIGISDQEQEKLFRRFYQVDGKSTRRFGGMGLGLALVKEVVQGHGGDVWVKSNSGEGSVFGFWLPLSARPCIVVGEPSTGSDDIEKEGG